MSAALHRVIAVTISIAASPSVGIAIADGSGELGCDRSYPSIYLVADHRADYGVVDLFLSDVCPGRVHLWTAAERLTANTIQQVGAAALYALGPVCVTLNTKCTGVWSTDSNCVRIPPVAITPIPSETCPPRELTIAGAASQSAGTVLRVPGTDTNGNVLRCVPPVVHRDALGRRYLAGTRLSGCEALLAAPTPRAEAPHPPAVSPATRFGGVSLVFSDGFFDSKSFALPHVITRMQGSTDGAGRVLGMGFPLSDLLQRWTFSYRVSVDLPAQLLRTDR